MFLAAEVVADIPIGRRLALHAGAFLHVAGLRRLLAADAEASDVGTQRSPRSGAADGGDVLAGAAAELVTENAAQHRADDRAGNADAALRLGNLLLLHPAALLGRADHGADRSDVRLVGLLAVAAAIVTPVAGRDRCRRVAVVVARAVPVSVPTLDVAGLTARLRDTKAIGVFTKLALKNQVDDLLKMFRVHYQSGQKTGVASLRPPYDMLVLKVLALVQDSDPSLARTISGSREAIWGILADRDKFNSIA